MNFLHEPWRLSFDREEIQKRIDENQTFFLPDTGLSFIDDHFGPRPGCLHTLLAASGRGKTTLLHSLIVAWGSKAKMLLYLTEESFDQVETKLFLKAEDVSYLTSKLHLLHETNVLESIKPDAVVPFLRFLSDSIIKTESKILIIDNLTTSNFYEGQFQNVNRLLSGLRKIAAALGVAIFIIAHTKKTMSPAKGLITLDDVRGSAALPMTSDYFYIFYRIRKTLDFGKEVDSSFVLVAKSRHHDNQDNFYMLQYDHRTKRYFKDKLVNFQIFKTILKERDHA